MEELRRLSGLPIWLTCTEARVAEALRGQVEPLLAMKLQEKYFALPEQRDKPFC